MLGKQEERGGKKKKKGGWNIRQTWQAQKNKCVVLLKSEGNCSKKWDSTAMKLEWIIFIMFWIRVLNAWAAYWYFMDSEIEREKKNKKEDEILNILDKHRKINVWFCWNMKVTVEKNGIVLQWN